MKNIYEKCHAAGGMSKYEWNRDPKRIGFILARYKFVAKMFEGRALVLEVGCADGLGSRVVRQHVRHLTAIDIDSTSIEEARALQSGLDNQVYFRNISLANFGYSRRDVMYDGVYALDVFEHIPKRASNEFLSNLSDVAKVCIIGTPSLESQQYASALSKAGHVNCVSGERLRKQCQQHWKNVFMFGMSDEVLHTGYLPMAHYLFALCVH
jgi:2-polyprenyl-3-methyl-5-hydroxy-6-metoxy-1,4-benzoquinol methylase